MKVGILSDTHNHIENIQKALEIFTQFRPDVIIHCGDATTIESIEWFCEYRLIFAFGNGDVINGGIKASLKSYNLNNYAGFVFRGEVGGKMVGVTHGHLPEFLDELTTENQMDYVFSGHTHLRMDQRIGKTRWINPGSLGGIKKQSRSLALLDLDTDELIFKMVD